MNVRKLKILAAVVEEYVRTGEPVGSKILSALPEINVSAATVRNDMAALEQMGYLEQPHTSAGRIPTISGYRIYIEQLMKPPAISSEEKLKLDSMFPLHGATEELVIQNATTALAELTKCAAVVSDASPKFSVISKVEVIPTGKRVYMILLITSAGSIKNKACRLEFDLTNEQLNWFSGYLSENLEGISVSDLSDELMENLTAAMSAYMMALTPLVQGIYEISKDLKQHALTVKGEQNLFSCEELDKMEIVRFIQHKDELSRLLDDSFSGIRVLFREEQNSFVIGNSSMIVSKYRKGGKNVGSLGVIGPMRLDYAKVIPYIEYFSQKVTDLISESSENVPNDAHRKKEGDSHD
ncbi:MAG: heat-inducible transcription repressor HrcA [Oscillospiraceae bacterium]|nr:heat-inducible transcription repressor HrcA [Oscillospiraceae bacterium]MBR7084494.1 heat-inducible transcription repressor HrcA [Oscillospiraceae bacterium]